jgi:hypothetical protein
MNRLIFWFFDPIIMTGFKMRYPAHMGGKIRGKMVA